MSAPPPLPPGIAPEDMESGQYDDDDDDSEGSTSESGGEEEEYDPAVPLGRLEGDAGDGQPLGDRRNSRDDGMDDSEGDKGFWQYFDQANAKLRVPITAIDFYWFRLIKINGLKKETIKCL